MKKLLCIIAAAMALIVASSTAMAEPKKRSLSDKATHRMKSVSTYATSSMASQQSNIQGIRGT